ncbi:hypothetical protein [Dyadobacter sp. CY356]|uniref:hypothetical protein n=1 Tax=Dyadobacter sp. CY356 TaxID=2906442 RepID=UPI001F292103|nr:hypothetical protein [Dyadobacter sp. CY356]MCF0057511.1 hypothetical protein [Dyadobacter sp. CY356]
MNNKVTISSFQFSLFTPILYVLLFLTSCDSAQERESKVMTYYDLKGFIESQVSSLNKEKPEVTKTMRVSGKNETLTSRNMDWKKELELFIQADINKPAYSKSYAITKPDSLTVLYKLKTEESLPVRYLKIEMDKISGTPVVIQALLRSENKLYQSEKNIEMHGSFQGGKWHLENYIIKGYQKLATMEKKEFDVSAKVKH